MEAEIPSTGLSVGDIAYADDTNKLFMREASAWVHVNAGGVGSAWGGITGTLSAQTDLQTALDAKETANANLQAHVASAHAPAGAEVNVNADWNAGSGDAQILNKPATYAPSAHSHVAGDVTGTAVLTADSRLSDARTPTAHATSHRTGGSDAIALDTFAAPTDVTTLNVSTTAHGLAPKLSNVATQYLSGTGGWTVPAGGGGGATKLVVTADRQNTTTAFANVTDLALAVNTATRYVFDCVLVSTTAINTTATQIAVNGPTTSSLRYVVETATTATAKHMAAQTVYDTNTNPATGAAAVALPIYVRGQMLTTAAGTFAVRFRSEIAASAVNVLAGSYCLVE